MKKILFVPSFIMALSISFVYASDQSDTYTKTQTTCSNYTSNLEAYLDTVLPFYLDDNITKSNQKSIDVYKKLLKEKRTTKTEVKMSSTQTIKLDYALAEALNIGKKSYIAGFIYNPFGYWSEWKHNTNFVFMKYTPENIKSFVLENDSMVWFCNNLEMFAYDNTLSEDDNKANSNLLQKNTQSMNVDIKKHTLEINKVKTKKISPVIIKNTNLYLWKLKYIVEELHILGAEG